MSDKRDDRNDIDRKRHREGDDCEPDISWMNAIARGDRTVFERLYLHYHGRLAHFLTNYTRDRDLVDEIINEAMWVVWRSAGEFRGESRVGTWIIGIAYRCLMKSLRDRPPPTAHVERDDDRNAAADVTHSTEEAERRELRDWLAHGLVLLPSEQRTTIELAYFLGQSCDEIATIMNCAVGTVKARMFHARLRLRNTLPSLAGGMVAHSQSAQG